MNQQLRFVKTLDGAADFLVEYAHLLNDIKKQSTVHPDDIARLTDVVTELTDFLALHMEMSDEDFKQFDWNKHRAGFEWIRVDGQLCEGDSK